MDPSSVITQVTPDNNDASHPFTVQKGNGVQQKETKKRPNFLCSIICCLGKKNTKYKGGKKGRDSFSVGKGGGGHGSGTSGSGDLCLDPKQNSQSKSTKQLLPEIRADDVGKKCIVIDLDETLVHSSFKPISNADFIVPVEIDNVIHQVYVLKRPYVDEFLCRMGELFECVLFTASLAKYADPVADLLDKWDVFHSRLFRESCVFHKGNYVKDLGKLGRELHQIIIVDNSPASYIFHPENAVPVASWFDDMNDRELLDLIPFLENISKVDSVYRILNDATNKGGGNSGTLNGASPSLEQNSSSASSSLQKSTTSPPPQPTVVSAAVS